MTPKQPLWLKELILVPHPNVTTPIGRVIPGTSSIPRVRTIYVAPNHPALTTTVPFALPVTYDTSTFVVSQVGTPIQPVLPDPLFAGIEDALALLDDAAQAEFLTRVYRLFASLPPAEPLAIAGGADSSEASKAVKRNGKDEAAPLS
jgi:hypothetical protein